MDDPKSIFDNVKEPFSLIWVSYLKNNNSVCNQSNLGETGLVGYMGK